MISHESFMKIAHEISKNSYANNKKVGCILVKSNNIIAIGYNGTAVGLDNQCEVDGITTKEVMHAESNAIAKCASSLNSSKDSTMYCTLSPCIDCSKLIVQAGIKRVFFKEQYRNTEGLDYLAKVGIETIELFD